MILMILGLLSCGWFLMAGNRRRSALVVLLAVLAAGPLSMSASWSDETPPAATAAGGDPFPEVVEIDVGGRRERLKRTGIATRKKLGIKFYRIAGYCDDDHAPRDVDALVAADVAKRLVLVMERDIADWVLRKSFEDAFVANDPDGRYTAEIKAMLDHLTSRPLKKGDSVVITHVPQTGIECVVCETASTSVKNLPFAHVVWNVYMGPLGVSPDLRSGLGAELVVD